ncbi:hypothetical protein ACKX2D_02935 [Lachnospiraceae bacterium YH-ros2226]
MDAVADDKMNEFELYTMMFFWIDNYYADSTDDRINNLIGEMNPFLWQDIGSADPANYDEFCRYMKGKTITLDNSFELAKTFAKTIDYVDVTEAFEESDYDKWKNGCKRYIAEEHKGGEAREI